MDLRALFSLLTRISELFARSVVIGLLPLLLVALAKAEQPKPPVADGKPLLVAAEGKSQPEQKADGKLSVLFAFSSAGDPCSYEFAARLVHDGVEVNSRRESLAARSLTWDEVKPYNVLALQMPTARSQARTSRTSRSLTGFSKLVAAFSLFRAGARWIPRFLPKLRFSSR